ncbi:Orotate phosphoribosyltransferase 2 Short=OPRT 2; Short=OPRTase 2 [Serendipita indica DSM 11827]|uniref:orotate phosphoribosyltransferase n=1 Tax=Serendipita indica (strain DSM 11827) TaxID=1109443 RepID=G4TE32_SERID|nr:Orotate phosphoribosyltransferase 2 Short=OPRT 2; Short=OPRTase 2 [Serendipita indica DSM 11827]CCA69586.1 probable orotate phosphoribosyltransferase [Serendipita indica DSM 11827]
MASNHKQSFLALCHEHQILKFGSFKVKSGRISPYFFNAGSFSTSSLLSSLGTAYAQTIADAVRHPTSSTTSEPPLDFDIIFGPAYKGIPLCAITAVKLADLDAQRFGQKEWCFNRKEVKDHGEGGMLVGAPLQGKRVLVIDDVITDGAAKREAVEIIRQCGGTLAGMIVAVDRQETTGKEENGRLSALGALKKEYNVPMLAIVTLADIVKYSEEKLSPEEREAMNAYREKYGSEDILV